MISSSEYEKKKHRKQKKKHRKDGKSVKKHHKEEGLSSKKQASSTDDGVARLPSGEDEARRAFEDGKKTARQVLEEMEADINAKKETRMGSEVARRGPSVSLESAVASLKGGGSSGRSKGSGRFKGAPKSPAASPQVSNKHTTEDETGIVSEEFPEEFPPEFLEASAAPSSGRNNAPGAMAVRGPDADDVEEGIPIDDFDEYRYDEDVRTQATEEQARAKIPEAIPLPEQDVDTPETEFMEEIPLARADSGDSDQSEEAKTALNWIKNHKLCTAIVLLAIVGGIVGGAVAGILTPSPPGPSPPPETEGPTPPPTPAPTPQGFEQIEEALTKITSRSVLTNPSTPQYEAMNWILNGDEFNLDFTDEQKLLQRYALATLYFATNGDNWTSKFGFLSSTDECEWFEERDGTEPGERVKYGVRNCNGGVVDMVNFPENRMEGQFPSEILEGIPNMVTFGVTSNNIRGTVPAFLTELAQLEDFRVAANNLFGTLPTDFGVLSKMTHLDMSTNGFSGPLPTSISLMTDLTSLRFTKNRLTGSVPSELAALTKLVHIYFDENEFTDGMETLCDANIPFTNFASDCLAQEVPYVPPKVSCSCCTFCCAADAGGCLFPNQGNNQTSSNETQRHLFA